MCLGAGRSTGSLDVPRRSVPIKPDRTVRDDSVPCRATVVANIDAKTMTRKTLREFRTTRSICADARGIAYAETKRVGNSLRQGSEAVADFVDQLDYGRSEPA
jgi:hypothetical protein